MSRHNQDFLQEQAYLAQLLALNAMLDAARAGAREEAELVAGACQALTMDSMMDPESEMHLQFFYSELLDAAERPPRLS